MYGKYDDYKFNNRRREKSIIVIMFGWQSTSKWMCHKSNRYAQFIEAYKKIIKLWFVYFGQKIVLYYMYCVYQK